jgi:hypothetical protein
MSETPQQRMHLPIPEVLRAASGLSNLAIGPHEPAIVKFGCHNCPEKSVQRPFEVGWLTPEQLGEILDASPEVPRAYVSGALSAIGRAQGCPILENGKPDCQHKEFLRTTPQRLNPKPMRKKAD